MRQNIALKNNVQMKKQASEPAFSCLVKSPLLSREI